MRALLFIILSFVLISVNAQKTVKYVQTDKTALLIPDSLSGSSEGIAAYIRANFKTDTDKARAAFVWIGKNIEYDIENAFSINFYQNSNEIVTDVLKRRKGVCMHFAELFRDISDKSGLTAVVVQGYTRQNGFVDYIPHAWCAAVIDGTWCLFDPTWGSGYIQNAKFVRQLNNYYFMTKPEMLIKSHIPFDPMWELLNYPVTNQQFYQGETRVDTTKAFFSYSDSIGVYLMEPETDRLISATRRIESNGVRNSMIFDRVQHNRREIEYYTNKQKVELQNKAIDIYNEAVNIFNDGVNRLNRFIDYRNHQFRPGKTDEELRLMLDEPDKLFSLTELKLKSVNTTDAGLSTSVTQLNKSLAEAVFNLNEQRSFLDKYFHTGKAFRKSLFYSYSWRGTSPGK